MRRVLKEGANNGRRFYACPGSKQVTNQMAIMLIVLIAALKFLSKVHWFFRCVLHVAVLRILHLDISIRRMCFGFMLEKDTPSADA